MILPSKPAFESTIHFKIYRIILNIASHYIFVKFQPKHFHYSDFTSRKINQQLKLR